jgi:hypothetical protein
MVVAVGAQFFAPAARQPLRRRIRAIPVGAIPRAPAARQPAPGWRGVCEAPEALSTQCRRGGGKPWARSAGGRGQAIARGGPRDTSIPCTGRCNLWLTG